MPPRSGRPGDPIPIVRLRGLPGGVLVPADSDDGADRLQPGDGVLGELELLLGRARPQEALARLAEADLDDATARVVRARAYLMDGRVDDARAALGARDDDDVALGDAALALAEGDLERAERRVLAARQRAPDLVGPAYLFALVRVSRGDMQQGAELLTAVARAVPSHAVARFQLGQILYAQGDPARAGTLYEMAWELEPTFVSPPLALCEMLVESRQYGEALSILERVCQAAPTSLPPRQMQLRILLELGEHDSALELGRRLHEQVPGDHDTTLLYADALIDAERPDEAIAVIDTLLAAPGLDPAQAVRALRLKARVALTQRRIDDAMELLRSAAREAPPAVAGEVCLELVHVGLAQQRPEDADLGLSLLTKSSDVSSLVSGALLARQHQLAARARALAEKAKSLVPGTPAAAQLEGFIAALGG
jgi:tetratricopeptide (TPR) repeat protein